MISLETVLDRTSDRLDEVEALLNRAQWISRFRLVVAALGVLAAARLLEGALSALWLLVPVIVFITLAALHEQTWRKIQRVERLTQLHRRSMLRMKADISGGEDRPRSPGEAMRRRGVRSRPSLEEEELVAARRDRLDRIGGGRIRDLRLDEHLGLFGSGELFDRVADHRTDAGGETLASWMLRPATHRESAERQEAIRELAPRVDLREAVAATGCISRWPAARGGALAGWVRNSPHADDHGEAVAWRRLAEEGALGGAVDGEDEADAPETPARKPPWSSRHLPRLLRVPVIALTGANALGLALWLAGTVGPAPLAFSLTFSVLIGVLNRPLVREADAVAGRLVAEIAGLREMIGILRNADFQSEAVKRLREEVEDAEAPLRRLERIRSLFHLRRNLVFTPFALLLFWASHAAWRMGRWRHRHEADLARWTAAAGEFDALLALGQYADERPGDVYAEFDEKPGLEAVAMGHPLIPSDQLARNSITLGRGDADFLIVTGSNMSGKSTLLRSLGANFVLARLGAPVTASRFHLGRLALGPSISSQDSLRDGVSRFLAELFALRAVLEAGAGAPVLCLLDEVLEGTNSTDRRIAVRALLGELDRNDAVGILTTHDLSLAQLADELPGRIRNMHFSEEIRDGRMRFDFLLRDGVLPRGNALELMRILNLPTPGGESAEYTALPDAAAGRRDN